jgi:hypothetical protein
VLSNAASFNPGGLAAAVADIYLDPADASGGPGMADAPAPPPGPAAAAASPRRAVSVPTRLLESYAGQWDVEGLGVVRLRRQGGELVAELRGQRLVLAAESDTVFLAEEARIRFVREPDRVDRLIVHSGGQAMAGRRVAPPTLGPTALAAYTGDYFSPETEALYRVVVSGDALVARHVRHGDIPLTPVDEDLFAGGQWFFGRAAFTRDEAGVIDGFRVTGGRVRDLRFVRLRDDTLPR